MKLRLLKLSVIGLALAAVRVCGTVTVSVVNTAPALVRAIQTSQGPEAVAISLAQVLGPYSELYKELFNITDIRGQCSRDAISGDAQLAGLVRLSHVEEFNAAINASVTSFKVGFPKFDSTELTVFLLPSFGRFEAQARTFHNKPVLLLDTEFFSRTMHGIVPVAVVHHELFHLYHGQVCPEVRLGTEDFFRTGQMPSLGILLWVEGLAVHAARSLNPDASDAELFPSAAIVAATERDFIRLVKEAADDADVATMPGISGYFYVPRMDTRSIPQNCGYVIGERLIDRMLKDNSPQQIMAMRREDLTSAIRRATAQIVDRSDQPNQAR